MHDFIQLKDKNAVLKWIIEVNSIIKAQISKELIYRYCGININDLNVRTTTNEWYFIKWGIVLDALIIPKWIKVFIRKNNGLI